MFNNLSSREAQTKLGSPYPLELNFKVIETVIYLHLVELICFVSIRKNKNIPNVTWWGLKAENFSVSNLATS